MGKQNLEQSGRNNWWDSEDGGLVRFEIEQIKVAWVALWQPGDGESYGVRACFSAFRRTGRIDNMRVYRDR